MPPRLPPITPCALPPPVGSDNHLQALKVRPIINRAICNHSATVVRAWFTVCDAGWSQNKNTAPVAEWWKTQGNPLWEKLIFLGLGLPWIFPCTKHNHNVSLPIICRSRIAPALCYVILMALFFFLSRVSLEFSLTWDVPEPWNSGSASVSFSTTTVKDRRCFRLNLFVDWLYFCPLFDCVLDAPLSQMQWTL